ncbi:MAG: hypothetical protein WC843_00385 [Candidatus Gracilibacteria bacterium]|jgi:Zn ribbon nucleic-acid-binding protein
MTTQNPTQAGQQNAFQSQQNSQQTTQGATQPEGQTRLKCKNPTCAKEFLVIPQEKNFYIKKQLPMPDFCPACRHQQRMALRAERKLYSRKCDKCSNSMLSTYPNDAPYKIYCQKCFWENIG